MILGKNIGNVFSEGREIQRVFSYGRLVWEKNRIDYNTTAFTVVALDDTVVVEPYYARKQGTSYETIGDFKYSINGSEWQESYGNGIQIKRNDTVNIISSDIWYCKITGLCDISGNIMSLIYGDDFVGQTVYPELPNGYYRMGFFQDCDIRNAANLVLPATTLTFECYAGMFRNCTSLTHAPKILPATTLTTYCYVGMFQNCTSLTAPPKISAVTLDMYCCQRMFQNCTSLTTAPELPAIRTADECYAHMFLNCSSLTSAPALPATSLGQACYADMFGGCTSLTTAPALPVKTLNYNCYSQMFRGCTSLTAAPELPATTLVYNCYAYMFEGCSNLNYLKCKATKYDTSAESYTECVNGWLSGVSPTGTFVGYRIGGESPLKDHIPSTWTVEYLN